MSRAVERSVTTAPESVELLDGGGEAYPRMLRAIGNARCGVYLEVDDAAVVEQGEAWIRGHFARSRSMTSVEAGSRLHRWLLDPLGRLVARLAGMMGRVIAGRRRRRAMFGVQEVQR